MATKIDQTAKYVPHTCQIASDPRTQNIALSAEESILYDKSNDVSLGLSYRLFKRRQLEESLVKRASCQSLNPEIFLDDKLHLFMLDPDKLQVQANSLQTLDASFHDQLSCAVNSFTFDGKTEGRGTPAGHERIRNWIRNMAQFGAKPSAEGRTFKASLNTTSNLFVIKTPIRNDNLAHEALVGMYVMNKLRRILPNYMYVYGYAKCSPPAVQNGILTWCSSSLPDSSYLITENISNATSWYDFLQRPDIEELDFIAVFLQLVNALNIAYKLYGYVHYDLHYLNVLVREYEAPIMIPYYGTQIDLKNPNGYIATKYVPIIIDYGYNRIKVGGKVFGNIKVGSEDNFPMFDIHKILGFSGEVIFARNKKLWDPVNKLYGFFRADLKTLIQDTLKNKTFYAPSLTYKTKTHDDFLRYVATLTLPDPVHTDVAYLNANGAVALNANTQMNTCVFYNKFGNDKIPANNLEFCEVYTTLVNKNDKPAIQWLNQRYDAEAHYLQEKNMVSNTYIRNILDQNQISLFTATSPLTQEVFVRNYKQKVENLLKIKDNLAKLASITRASICALSAQDKYKKYQTELNAAAENIKNLLESYSKQKEILKQNDSYLKLNPLRRNSFDLWFPNYGEYINAS